MFGLSEGMGTDFREMGQLWQICMNLHLLPYLPALSSDRQEETVVQCEGFFSSLGARKLICSQRVLLKISNSFQLFLYAIHNVAFLCTTIKLGREELTA